MTNVVGYLIGDFDLFHVGHVDDLRQAEAHCDVLVVGVLTDAMVEAQLGRPPFTPLAERLEIVAAMRQVSAAVPEEGQWPPVLDNGAQCDVLLVGATDVSVRHWPTDPLVAAGVRVERLSATSKTSSHHLTRALAPAPGLFS